MPVGGIRLRRRARGADRPVAAVVGVGNLLLCVVLLLMAVGATPLFEVTTGEQETAAEGRAFGVYGCWLAGGLVLFSVLAMGRALVVHLATMLATPSVLALALAMLS